MAEISLCGDYQLAARWYRQAAAVAGQEPKAREMLDRIQKMATAALLAAKPKPGNGKEEEQPYKNVLLLLMVLLFLGAGVGIVLMSGDDPLAPSVDKKAK